MNYRKMDVSEREQLPYDAMFHLLNKCNVFIVKHQLILPGLLFDTKCQT